MPLICRISAAPNSKDVAADIIDDPSAVLVNDSCDSGPVARKLMG
jgi:hypothetical protein